MVGDKLNIFIKIKKKMLKFNFFLTDLDIVGSNSTFIGKNSLISLLKDLSMFFPNFESDAK